MFTRRNPMLPYCWIPDVDPAIDAEKWPPEARSRYFGIRGDADYTLPPLLPGETPMRVFVRPLSHEDYLKIQAMEQQKGSSVFDDAEIREYILRACVVGMSGVGEEVVGADGTVTEREIPQSVLFDATGKITSEGMGFFQHPVLAMGATSVAWILSHPRSGKLHTSPPSSET